MVLTLSAGMSGIMEAICKGARNDGGRTIGPSFDLSSANAWVETPVVTGLGQMRNMLVVANGDVVVAVGGVFGTLSEVALARKSGKTVIASGAMVSIEGVLRADDPDHALSIIQSL
jgi:uncharacterized protein (TIGR00725 family)